MCWDWYERRERVTEQQRAHDEEARLVEAEAEDEAGESASEKDERELVPA